MRSREPSEVELWADFAHIIDSALDKLPPQEVTVYRGFHVSLTQVSHEFQQGKVVWLPSVSSATTDEKRTLKFFGSGSSSSPGTLMKIYALFAKDMQPFSVMPAESELVFPLNTCLSIERVVTSQELMSLSGLIDYLPAHVDLIVARQQRVSRDTVTSAITKDAQDLFLFHSQHFATISSLVSIASHGVLSTPPLETSPALAPAASAPTPNLFAPTAGCTVPTFPPVSPDMSTSAWSSSGTWLPSRLPHGFSTAPSFPLVAPVHSSFLAPSQAHAHVSTSPSVLPIVHAKTPADALAALQLATSDISASVIAYFDDIDFASQLCYDLATSEYSNHGSSAAQFFLDARTSLHRVAALQSLPTAKEQIVSALAAAEALLSSDPDLRIELLEQQLQQIRAASATSSALFKQPVTLLSSIQALCSRARTILSRPPCWPRHASLIRFDLPLLRFTTHFAFSKKWFPRNFSLRGSRLYYCDGKFGYPDTAEGTLAFVQSNPHPDGRYCVDVQGKEAKLLIRLYRL